jgi:hypothetical protein
MWRCPRCGEPINDQFHACWKCAEARPVKPEPSVRQPEASRFSRYWRRAWLVLFLTALVGSCARFAVYAISGATTYSARQAPGRDFWWENSFYQI